MRRYLPISSSLLSVLLIVLIIVQYSSRGVERVEARIEANLDEELQEQKSDLITFMEQFTIYSNPFDISSDKKFLKRVYVNGGLVYWSDNLLLPEYPALHSQDSLYALQFRGDRYLVMRQQVGNGSTLVEIFSFLPLVTNPPIINQYLHQQYNEDVFEEFKVRLGRGEHYLDAKGISLRADIAVQSPYLLDYWILAVALLLGLIFGFWLLVFKRKKGRSFTVMVFRFTLVIFLIRGLLWILTSTVVNVPLFNPIFYTSAWGYSLGDLLLNIAGLFLFLQFFETKLSRRIPLNDWAVLLIIFTTVSLGGVFTYLLTWNLLDNSLLSLDISRLLSFDIQRVSAFLILIIAAAIFFKVFHLAIYWFRELAPEWWKALVVQGMITLLISFVVNQNVWICLGLLAAGWWVITVFKLRFDYVHLDYRAFLFVSVLIGLVALINALAVYKHFEKDELVSKKKFANRLLIKNDFLGEYYLNERIRDIQTDAYIRSRLNNRLLSVKNVKEKIRQQYLSSYFDKYDAEILLFDSDGRSIDGLKEDYENLKSQFALPKFHTDYDGIYFVEDKADNIQDKYYCFIPVTSFDRPVGYIVLSLTLKKYIPQSVFPHLMVEGKYYLSDEDRFDYAAFREGKLIYKRGRYEFQNTLNYPDLTNSRLFGRGLEKSEMHFYGLKSLDGTTYVIASPTYSKLSFVSNFSFLYLIILFFFALTFSIARYFDKGIAFNFSTKIQLYLGLSFVVPMLIVSVALLNTLNESYKDEIDNSFSKKAYNISDYLIDVCERFNNNEINRDEFSNTISRVASLIQSDINLYAVNGQLIGSSEVEIFNLGLLGTQIAPGPYNAIKYGNAETKVHKQQIGDLDFRVSYVGLRSYKDGRLLGILSMPYFDSKNHLKRQQIEVFNNLISIFTIIFLLSLIAGNLVIERLVKPLKLITQRLKLTDLKEVNQPIEYESADEIGILIEEYNQMIQKLEDSKAALAESQKESAWKEIARQVAHEIKNPLTPMRLKIQQLMRQKDSNSKEYQSLNSLIGQIDALSSIADSFSAFAKMPAPRNEPFDLAALVREVVDIHDSEHAMITLSGVDGIVYVNADRKIFSGIFNNIILNAIQAASERRPEIHIDMDIRPKKVLVSVRDNGEGIDEAHHEKIFTPYFSTKSTGSGIGLAVAKKGIENAGGNIWFETKVGVGTTFYISMPLQG